MWTIARAGQLIGPILAALLITGVGLTFRRTSERRIEMSGGAQSGWGGVRTRLRCEPAAYRFLCPNEPGAVPGRLTFARIVLGRIREGAVWDFGSLDEWCDWAPGFFAWQEDWTARFQPGWLISRWLDEQAECTSGQLFWRIQALRFLDPQGFANEIDWIEIAGRPGRLCTTQGWSHYDYDRDTLFWNPVATEYTPDDPDLSRQWHRTAPLVTLAYVLGHMCCDLSCSGDELDQAGREQFALTTENRIRHALFRTVPGCSHIWARPGFRETWPDIAGPTAEEAWQSYAGRVDY